MDILINNTDKIWLERFSAPSDSGYIVKLGMRTGQEVATDLSYEMRDLLSDCEWSGVGLDFQYQVFPALHNGKETKVQLNVIPHDVVGIMCFAQVGQNEGDLAYVKLLLRSGRTCTLFSAKTFNGNDHAWQIARKAAELLEA
jgi:hypothetical protein